MCREVEPAELQKLTMMTKAPQVSSFRQNRQRVDRSDAWNSFQALEVGALAKKLLSVLFDRIPARDQVSALR